MGNRKKVFVVANVVKEHILKFHIPTIKEMTKRGWTVDVGASGDETVPYCHQQYSLPHQRSPFHLGTLKSIWKLRKILKSGGYDIVYCHTPVGGLVGRLASLGLRKQGTRVIYFAHGYHFYKGATFFNWLVYYPIEKLLSLFTDSIILINQEDYHLTKTKFKQVQSYLVSGMGVKQERFSPQSNQVRERYRKELKLPEDATVLIYCAELIKNKNQTFLLHAMKKLVDQGENLYCLLVGIDYTKGEMVECIQSLNLSDRVLLLGWREDIANLYACSDICVATSIREGFGLNIVEAMFCHVPVVATINRGHASIIQDGQNGLLVQLGNTKQLIEAIYVLMKDTKKKQELVEQASANLEQYHSQKIVNSLLEIIEQTAMK